MRIDVHFRQHTRQLQVRLFISVALLSCLSLRVLRKVDDLDLFVLLAAHSLVVYCFLIRAFDDLLSIHSEITAFAQVSLTDFFILFVTFLQVLELFVYLHFFVLNESQDLVELHAK